MKTQGIMTNLILIALVGACSARAEEVAPSGFVDTQEFLSNYSTNFKPRANSGEGPTANQGSNTMAIRPQAQNQQSVHSPMSSEEIMCLLRAIKVNEKDARSTALAFTRALDSLKLSSKHFNRTSLMHLLAQSYKESARFHTLTQQGKNIPPDKRGYGYIQVTGKENRKEAAQCMAKADPGSEKDVYEFPGITIGRYAYQAALATLCWWKKNIIENPHFLLSLMPETVAAEKITHIVNAGDINDPITGGEANARERASVFRKLMLAEPKCRQNQ